MVDDPKNPQPMEMAGAVDLLAHPVAGVAALSAFGFGLASHAFGFWMGTLTGMASASQLFLDQQNAAASPHAPAKQAEASRKATAEIKQFPTGGVASKRRTAARAGTGVRKSPASVQAPALAREVSAGDHRGGDDLKAIAGVGPKLEQVLNGLGIHSYRQVAALTGEEIVTLEQKLGLQGRIERDGWTAQAMTLAGSSGAGSSGGDDR
jgi:NADH-quinone oxidoreductase subunit E